ncbi:suppressor of fused domain protein [Pirellulaceae bacterium SH501]|jgi:hypothetical protein
MQSFFQSEQSASLGQIDLGDGPLNPELFWVDAMSMDYPFQTVFSLGLSNQRLSAVGRVSHFDRVELIMHLPISWPAKGKRLELPEYQWPVEWMRQLVLSIGDGSIPLPGPHVIVSNNEPPEPLGEGTDQSCLLLLADFYQFFPLKLNGNEELHFYHVIPLYAEEREFEKGNGMTPLLEAMAAWGMNSLVVCPDRNRFV